MLGEGAIYGMITRGMAALMQDAFPGRSGAMTMVLSM